MVDPNRKINRLSDEDAAFLLECENEFRSRYTMNDEEFSSIYWNEVSSPPILEPWESNRRPNQHYGGGGRGGRGGGYQHWRNNRNNRDGQHNNYRSQYQNNRSSYDRRRSGGDNGGNDRNSDSRYRPHKNFKPY